jgi:hypothetical protein
MNPNSQRANQQIDNSPALVAESVRYNPAPCQTSW